MSKRKTYKQGIEEGREQRTREMARALQRESVASDIIERVTGIREPENNLKAQTHSVKN